MRLPPQEVEEVRQSRAKPHGKQMLVSRGEASPSRIATVEAGDSSPDHIFAKRPDRRRRRAGHRGGQQDSSTTAGQLQDLGTYLPIEFLLTSVEEERGLLEVRRERVTD